jgi:hypothetical protein
MTEHYLQRYEGTHVVTGAHSVRVLKVTGQRVPIQMVREIQFAVASATGRSTEPEISLSHPQI